MSLRKYILLQESIFNDPLSFENCNIFFFENVLDTLELFLIGTVHTDTFSNPFVFIVLRFQIHPLWIAHSNVCVFMIVVIISV